MGANPPASADAMVAPFAGLSRAEKVFTITGSLLGLLLAALDQTVVVTALLPIIRDIGAPITRPDRAAWIVSGNP